MCGARLRLHVCLFVSMTRFVHVVGRLVLTSRINAPSSHTNWPERRYKPSHHFADCFLFNSLRFARATFPWCDSSAHARSRRRSTERTVQPKGASRCGVESLDRSILLSRPTHLHARKRKLEKISTTSAEETRATRAEPLASSQAMGCQPSIAEHLPFSSLHYRSKPRLRQHRVSAEGESAHR
jgi:hypothetical protein